MNITKTEAHEAELAPLRKKLAELKALKFSVNEVYAFERNKAEITRIREQINAINARHGIFVDYNIINSDKDHSPSERYGRFSPKVTFTVGAGMSCLFAYAPRHLDSHYDLHDWLVKIGAVRKDTINDHESGGLYYYLSSEASAKAFVDRVNKALAKLVNSPKYRRPDSDD